MKLSIVSTLFYSGPYIEEFYSRVSSVAQKIADDDYEIVFVNDGCPNTSLEVALKLVAEDSLVVVIDLSRNFGHHKAMMTGLEKSRGDLVFLIDSDLEEEPEWLLLFWEQLREEKCDVVFGAQDQRRGKWFERLSGQLFYSVMRALSGRDLPSNIVTARLMTRSFVDALVAHREREVFLAGLWSVTGFQQNKKTVVKRRKNKTTYSFRRKLSLFINAVTSFSSKPLVLIANLGLLILVFTIGIIIYLFIQYIFFSKPLDGWTSIKVFIWLFGG